MTKLSVCAMVVIGMVSGCSGVQIHRVTDATYDEGLRFYRPDPYLLVTDTPDKGRQTTVIWLPNYNQEYAVCTVGWWGSSEVTATLDDGWNLTSLGVNRDSKISDILTAISGSVGSAAAWKTKEGVPTAEKQGEIKPGIYRFIFKDNSVTLEQIPVYVIPDNPQ